MSCFSVSVRRQDANHKGLETRPPLLRSFPFRQKWRTVRRQAWRSLRKRTVRTLRERAGVRTTTAVIVPIVASIWGVPMQMVQGRAVRISKGAVVLIMASMRDVLMRMPMDRVRGVRTSRAAVVPIMASMRGVRLQRISIRLKLKRISRHSATGVQSCSARPTN